LSIFKKPCYNYFVANTLKEPLITISEFLTPWVEHAVLLIESLGAPQDCRSLNPPGGLLAKYAQHVLAAVQKETIPASEKEQLLHQADWMVDTLSGLRCSLEDATGLGAARLPESFWSLPSGRTLITVYIKLLGSNLLPPIHAARQLGVDAQSVYRLMYTARLPSYPDFLSPSNRKAHRIRMDQLKLLLAEGDGADN
jgi:hypothetical protein